MIKVFFFLSVLFVFCGISESSEIRVHSHRGETDFAPQNTVEAIKIAFQKGSLMIETDFHLTDDGTMLCMHGRRELKEFWGIDKVPHELTAEEIRQARFASTVQYPDFADCKIPTIDEVFAAIPKDKKFELEIKYYGDSFADKVESARIKAGLDHSNFIITSFREDEIKDFKIKYPLYETLLIVSINRKNPQSAEQIIARAKNANASQIALGNYRLIDAVFVKKIRDAGLKVGIWQVENLDDLAFAVKLGADRICSNHAYRLREDFKLLKCLDFK